jgi:hypothetical protein
MSTAEIIEQIKKLTPEERRKVRSCLEQLDDLVKELDAGRTKTAGLVDKARAATSTVNFIPSETFEAAKKKVFAENHELLRRLAK